MVIDRDFVRWNKDYPLVIIGDAVLDYKKNYDGVILSISNIQELRDKVAYYTGMSDIGRVLVIEDISFLGKEAVPSLLKFIEESTIPIVLLSRYDKFDSVILSRVKKVIKYYKTRTTSKFLKPKDGQEQIDNILSEDSSYYDVVRYWGTYSPKLYLLDKVVATSRIKKRVMSFID